MGKIKRIFKGEKGPLPQFMAYSTLFVLVLLVFAPGNNLINWAKARIEINHQEKLIKKYESDIERMEHKIKMLSSDKDSLEKFAREQFYLAEPGDDVYILED